MYLKRKKITFYSPKLNNFFSFFKVVSLSNSYLKKKNFESTRRFLSRKLKKRLKFSIRKSTYKYPSFKKPSKNRMGKGMFTLVMCFIKIKK